MLCGIVRATPTRESTWTACGVAARQFGGHSQFWTGSLRFARLSFSAGLHMCEKLIDTTDRKPVTLAPLLTFFLVRLLLGDRVHATAAAQVATRPLLRVDPLQPPMVVLEGAQSLQLGED